MKRVATIIVGAALISPGTALASGNASCQSYSQQACVAAGNAGSGTTGPGTTGPGSTGSQASTVAGTLPFTGLDIGLLLAGSGTLLGAGFVVRRLSEDVSE